MKSYLPEIKRINQSNIENIYYLVGSDHYMQTYFYEKLCSLFIENNPIEKYYFIAGHDSSQDIIEALFSTDIFNSRKLIFMRNPSGLKGKYVQEFIDYINNPIEENILLIIQDEFGKNNKLLKTLTKSITPISTSTPFKNEMKIWANKFFKDFGIEKTSKDCIDYIIETSGSTLSTLKGEIEKISLNFDSKSELTIEDININSINNKSNYFYEFFNFLGKRDAKNALSTGFNLLNNNATLIKFINPLCEFFQKLLFIKIFNGTNDSKNSYTFSYLAPSVNKNLDIYAANFKNKEIVYALKNLGKIDYYIKNSKINDKSALSQFILSILSKNGK